MERGRHATYRRENNDVVIPANTFHDPDPHPQSHGDDEEGNGGSRVGDVEDDVSLVDIAIRRSGQVGGSGVGHVDWSTPFPLDSAAAVVQQAMAGEWETLAKVLITATRLKMENTLCYG